MQMLCSTVEAVGRIGGKTAITIREAALPQRVSGAGMSQICHSLFARLFPRALTFSLSLISSHPQILLSEGSSRNRTFVSHAGLSLVPAMAEWKPECTCPPLTYFPFWRSGSSQLTLSAWASKPIKQDVVYGDPQGLQSALTKLQRLPPLVTTQEVCLLASDQTLC